MREAAIIIGIIITIYLIIKENNMENIYVPPIVAIRIYTALIEQTGTGQPTVKMLHNTFKEEIVWTRVNTGEYVGTAVEEIFKEDKTTIICTTKSSVKTIIGTDLTTNTIGLFQYITGTTTPVDGITQNTIIELKVYNQN